MAPPRVYCSVYGCLNSSIYKRQISYFKLPSDTERRLRWLHLIGREDLIEKRAKSYTVCEEHFHIQDILLASHRKNLKKNAIPSLHLPNFQKNEDGQTSVVLTDLETILKNQQNPQKRKIKSESSKSKKKKLDKLEDNSSNKDTFYRMCDRFLTKDLADLVIAQTYLKSNFAGSKQQDYKNFCLNLYLTSPQAYRLLQKALGLPCPKALNKHSISITTKVNDKVLSTLKTKVDNMTRKEKQCSLMIGAMKLKTNLIYNVKEDKIIGFQEVDGVQSPEPAKDALVVLVCGILVNWKQPVGYALLARNRNIEDISKWIDKLLQKLIDIGLEIRTLVTDIADLFPEANNKTVTVDPYFFVNGKKVYQIYDAPHLMKTVRNYFLANNFQFKDCLAKFEHILQFYEEDKEKSCRFGPKLTNSHINPTRLEKNKTCYATQLLSHTVAAGLSAYVDFNVIDKSARDTVKFIKLMNNLFDILNSTNLIQNNENRKAFRGEDWQVNILNESLELFQTLTLLDLNNGQVVTSNVKFINGFQITIRSILLLFEDLKSEGFDCLPTKRLTQVALENYFTEIKTKSGATGDLTCWQFVSTFKKFFFSHTIESSRAGNAEDVEKIVTLINSLQTPTDQTFAVNEDDVLKIETEDSNVNSKEPESDTEIDSSEYNQLNLPENHALFYIASYLLKKCAEYHQDCEHMAAYVTPPEDKRFSNYEGDDRYQRYTEYVKDTNSSLRIVPCDDFVTYVENMEDKFRSNFQKDQIDPSRPLTASIYKELKEVYFTPPCPCFPRGYLNKLFIRIRIFYAIKLSNRAFSNTRNKRHCFNVFL
uniref:THAP-type domain-containing protein n=1 Tax=Pectinophora gossypiella TaxID=13191 RepID=A0A1E1W8R2_PECGO